MKSDNLKLEVHSCEQDLDRIRSDWEWIVSKQSQANLFVTPLWVINYWQHRKRFGSTPKLLVAKTAGGEMVGLVPLASALGLGRKAFPQLRAVHSTGEYESDWICDATHVRAFVATVWDYLISQKRQWFQLTTNVVREDSPILAAVRDECEDRGLTHRLQLGWKIPFLLTDATSGAPTDVLGLVKPKYRRELRRRRKRLEALGALQFEEYNSVDDLEVHFEEFVTVEATGWKGQTGTAIRCEPDAKRFWWNLARESAQQNTLRLHLLRLNNNVISGQLGIVWGGRYYCLKVGYDEAYRQYGPGALMTQHTIQRCFDDPCIKVYDFAGEAQSYMWNWTDRFYNTWQLSVGTPELVRGTLYDGLVCGSMLLRRIRGTIRSFVRPRAAYPHNCSRDN